MTSFLSRSALLLLGTVFCISGNGLLTAFAEESRDVIINPLEIYTSCEDIPEAVSVVKVDVHIAAAIICAEPKASTVLANAFQ